MTPEEIIDHFVDNAKWLRTNHLTPDKIPALEAQLADPGSWVNRTCEMLAERVRSFETFDFRKAINNRTRIKHGRPPEPPGPDDHKPARGDPQAAADRDVIVRFVRGAAESGKLPESIAVRVLAEAGESLSWIDSVPDRLIMSERIVPAGGSPVERRMLLALCNPVLSDLIAEQNGKMRARLTEAHPDLAAELRQRLAECGNTPRAGGRGA